MTPTNRTIIPALLSALVLGCGGAAPVEPPDAPSLAMAPATPPDVSGRWNATLYLQGTVNGIALDCNSTSGLILHLLQDGGRLSGTYAADLVCYWNGHVLPQSLPGDLKGRLTGDAVRISLAPGSGIDATLTDDVTMNGTITVRVDGRPFFKPLALTGAWSATDPLIP